MHVFESVKKYRICSMKVFAGWTTYVIVMWSYDKEHTKKKKKIEVLIYSDQSTT